MSPEAARILVSCAISFALGGFAGVFGLRTLYGQPEHIKPATPIDLECPKPSCPPCNVAQPTTNIDGSSSQGYPLPAEGSTPPSLDPSMSGQPRPGLPASAVEFARAAVERELSACAHHRAPESGARVVLLHLTVTTANGNGHISDAWVAPSNKSNAILANCLARAAREARFDWTTADGEITFKLPVALDHL